MSEPTLTSFSYAAHGYLVFRRLLRKGVGGKPVRRKATYLDKVKNEWSYTPTPPHTFTGTNLFTGLFSTW